MRVVFDVEADQLHNSTKIWVIVCKDIDTGCIEIFRNVTDDEHNKNNFMAYSRDVTTWIGHNIIEFDLVVLHKLLGLYIPVSNTIDTLILSRLVNYSRKDGHSLEQYGIELGYPKGKSHYLDFFKQWSQELEDYCVRDVEICHRVYNQYADVISSNNWTDAIRLEHDFQSICNDLHFNGFALDVPRAKKLLEKVQLDLGEIDAKIQRAFPKREVVVRTFIPRATKFGTISQSSIPKRLRHNIHNYEIGNSYNLTEWVEFNPSSHTQLITVLNEAGWKPEDKTDTHKAVEREYNSMVSSQLYEELPKIEAKLNKFKITGWKINETNLATLPDTAPAPARMLAKRILLESRRRTLTEWLSLVREDGRIHGRFLGIGAWTHRMAHQEPNLANVPREFHEDGSIKFLGKELRQLWIAPKKRLLVGVDAEGIQLRIFAHYIDDAEFTDALVRGSKADKTDPHSLNQRVLGSVCKSRQAAKRFIYALLLGGGIDKLSAILGCTKAEAREALDRLMQRYTGFATLRKTRIQSDAKRGFFEGIDGRQVCLPGTSIRDKAHLCMSGYLQNGEAIIIKRAAIITNDQLQEEKKLKRWGFVDIVHDELQSEVYNDLHLAKKVAEVKAEAIKTAGEYYKLKCPMAGSYWNDDVQDYTIGLNWYQTH